MPVRVVRQSDHHDRAGSRTAAATNLGHRHRAVPDDHPIYENSATPDAPAQAVGADFDHKYGRNDRAGRCREIGAIALVCAGEVDRADNIAADTIDDTADDRVLRPAASATSEPGSSSPAAPGALGSGSPPSDSRPADAAPLTSTGGPPEITEGVTGWAPVADIDTPADLRPGRCTIDQWTW